MAKKASKEGFSMRGFDVEHYRQTDECAQAVDKLYNTAIHSFSRLAGSVKVDPDKPFDFASSAAFQRRAQEIVNTLAKSMTAVIQHGSEEQWLYACKKNDAFIAHIMDTSKVGKRQLKKMQDKNLDALDAFQRRKVGGLGLSQRVWQYAGQMKGLMELGIDIAVGEGRSAEELSRDLREYLKEPHKLFRRVRDKHGNLVLSKRAAQYHPGQGVYRSSYKNAIRLARTEINMAYRDSDRYRWNNMDFIVGYRVHLSNNHTLNGEPFHDICDELAGDYPKDFVFKGWHPNCRCFVTPILQDPEEFNTDELNELKAAFHGKEYKKFQSRNAVTDVPESFKKWVSVNKAKTLQWKTQPYWIRDNFKGGTLEGGLHLVKPTIPKPTAAEKKAIERKAWADLTDAERDRYILQWQKVFDNTWFMMYDVSESYHIDMSAMDMYRDKSPNEYWLIPDAIAEKERLIARFDEVGAMLKADIDKLRDKAIRIAEECAIWSEYGTSKDKIETICLSYGYGNKRWPNYGDMMSHLDMVISKNEDSMQRGKRSFNSIVYDCGVIIKMAAAKGVDTTKLASLSSTTPTAARTAPMLIKEIREEAKNVQDLIDGKEKTTPTVFDEVLEDAKKVNVKYNEVKPLDKELTERQIIERLAGGDMTKGSCASLALTYAGNRSGLDVLDFRGGESCNLFSKRSTLTKIAKGAGGVVNEEFNDFTNAMNLLNTVVEGKEYFFGVASHAAIVRRTSAGLEYLELQSRYENGFKPLDRAVLKRRFGCKNSHSIYGTKTKLTAYLIEISLLKNGTGFQTMLGYINTAESGQRKGSAGSIK